MTTMKNFWTTVLTVAAMAIIVVSLTRLFSAGNHPVEAHHSVKETHSERSPPPPIIQINYAPAYAALDPLLNNAIADAASLFDPGDDYWGLPRSQGYEETAAYCTACHSLRIVMQQRQTRDGWDYLLTWMRDKQGMAEPFPEDRELLLDYLTREFGAGL